MANVEIYPDSPKIEEVIAWVRSVLEESVFNFEDDEMILMEGEYGGVTVPVVIQKKVEDGPFVGVWFNADHTPWGDDRACAPDAWQHFQVAVQCDPGDEFPEPDQFLQIDKNGEWVIRLPGNLQ